MYIQTPKHVLSMPCIPTIYIHTPSPTQIRVKGDQDAIFAHLSQEEMEMWLDLRPFMQRHPFVVQADASLSRAYRLFRTMGLRHLFVGPPQPKVVGIITRKDIIGDNAKLALGRKANLGLTTVPAERRNRDLPFIPYAAYDATVGSSLRRAYAGDDIDEDDEELYMFDGMGGRVLVCSVGGGHVWWGHVWCESQWHRKK